MASWTAVWLAISLNAWLAVWLYGCLGVCLPGCLYVLINMVVPCRTEESNTDKMYARELFHQQKQRVDDAHLALQNAQVSQMFPEPCQTLLELFQKFPEPCQMFSKPCETFLK
jgi:hypothetical protein